MKKNTLKLSEFKSLLSNERFSDKQFVFWIGSGIDKAEPTCLPLAMPLLQNILENTCGELSNKLLQIWNDVEKIINAQNMSANQFPPIPRLETIIEKILTCENHMLEKHSVVNSLESFGYAPPNKNHYAIANALKNGADVVTTNYSFCIQQAYQDIVGIELELEEHFQKSSIYMYGSNHKGSGKLYHIHGIASNITDIGASLGMVKKSFPTEFSQKILDWFDQKRHFLFCGYSGSDAFDVNRFFLTRCPDSVASYGFFIRHTDSCKYNDEYNIFTEKEKILLRVFEKDYLICDDTSKILNLFLEPNISIKSYKNYNWEIRSSYPSEYRQCLLIDICGNLGLNIDLFYSSEQWDNDLNDNNIYTPWYNIYPKFVMSRLQNNRRLITKYGEAMAKIESRAIIQRLINGSLQTYMCPTEQKMQAINKTIETHINQGTPINWNLSTDINLITHYIITQFLQCDSFDMFEDLLKKYKEISNDLINVCTAIVHYGYDFVVDMNQLHLAMRNLALLKQIFKKDFDNAKLLLDESTYYYIEVSSIDGILGNLNAMQIMYFIQAFYTNDMSYLDNSKKAYDTIQSICEVTKFYRHQDIAQKNRNSIKNLLSHFQK